MKNNNFSKGFHDHLSYYIENDISPVHQNISNLKNHFDRRGFLYDNLGINQHMINNSKILELVEFLAETFGDDPCRLYRQPTLIQIAHLVQPSITALGTSNTDSRRRRQQKVYLIKTGSRHRPPLVKR